MSRAISFTVWVTFARKKMGKDEVWQVVAFEDFDLNLLSRRFCGI